MLYRLFQLKEQALAHHSYSKGPEPSLNLPAVLLSIKGSQPQL